MAVVAGVDFGTLGLRVSIVDSERGLLDSAAVKHRLHRERDDPEYATQRHDDHMCALASATREAVRRRVFQEIKSWPSLDTTSSSVIPVGQDLWPLGEI